MSLPFFLSPFEAWIDPFLLPFGPFLSSLPTLPGSSHPSYLTYLHVSICILAFLMLLQSSGFARPPPVAKKKLPRQPKLSLQFTPPSSASGLPDSFAPLLSSSHLEVLYDLLSADQLHALRFEGELGLQPGKHPIPFHKNSQRPPLTVSVPASGTTVSLQASVGSDSLHPDVDFDPSTPVTDRSRTMVKDLTASISPPLALGNVAATLVHLPNLFEDHAVPSMRRVQILQWAMDFLSNFTMWIEKLLWSLEQYLTIHLARVKVQPVFRGGSNAHFRLSLSFSGYVSLFNTIPIPFISVSLPTMIIPAPYALLHQLATKQPLASAKVKHSNIPANEIALAASALVKGFRGDLRMLATPPTVGIDVSRARRERALERRSGPRPSEGPGQARPPRPPPLTPFPGDRPRRHEPVLRAPRGTQQQQQQGRGPRVLLVQAERRLLPPAPVQPDREAGRVRASEASAKTGSGAAPTTDANIASAGRQQSTLAQHTNFF
jgi:hypothetical protein